jgi:hypothetical protein
VNRGEVEAIKGIQFANLSETIESVGMRSTKYAVRMSTAQELESISIPPRFLALLNEGMDEIYDEAEEETPRYKFVDQEVDSIMRQAFNGGKKDYSFDRKTEESEVDDRIRLRIKRYNSIEDEGSPTNSMSTLNFPNEEITLPFGSLDCSLDMLKSELIKNEIVIQVHKKETINTRRSGSRLREVGESLRISSRISCLERL